LAAEAKGRIESLGHAKFPGAVTVSGKDGADAKRYQEKQVRQAIELTKK